LGNQKGRKMKILIAILILVSTMVWADDKSFEVKETAKRIFSFSEMKMISEADSVVVDRKPESVTIIIYSHHYKSHAGEGVTWDEATGMGMGDLLYRPPTLEQDTTKIFIAIKPKEIKRSWMDEYKQLTPRESSVYCDSTVTFQKHTMERMKLWPGDKELIEKGEPIPFRKKHNGTWFEWRNGKFFEIGEPGE